MMSHQIQLARFQSGNDFTHGFVRTNYEFECFSVEDEKRNVKVAGETRIPEGVYHLKLREAETPLTTKYRKKFDWFKYHIEVTGVPGFKYVYIHIGNDDDDTGGCICLGQTCDSTKANGFVGRSTQAYEAFYKKVLPWLENGEDVLLNVIDL